MQHKVSGEAQNWTAPWLYPSTPPMWESTVPDQQLCTLLPSGLEYKEYCLPSAKRPLLAFECHNGPSVPASNGLNMQGATRQCCSIIGKCTRQHSEKGEITEHGDPVNPQVGR